MEIQYLVSIKHPSNDLTENIFRWIFDIRILNIPLMTPQIDIQYSNVRHPSDHLQDEYLIFEYQTSILPTPRWIFNIKCPQIDTVKLEMFAND